MLLTEKEAREYCMVGNNLIASVKTQVGTLLKQERLKNNQSLEDIATIINWSPKKLENMELGQRHMNWHRCAQLLKIYKKELYFNLTDKEQII